MSDMFQNMLRALGSRIGLETIEMDSDTQCSLGLNGFLLLMHHLRDGNQMLLSTQVADLDQGAKEPLYRSLLQGQYFFHETAGASLSVDPEESFVALQAVYGLESLAPETFPALVENFLRVAEYWRERCAGGAAPAPPTRQGRPASSLEHMLSQGGMIKI